MLMQHEHEFYINMNMDMEHVKSSWTCIEISIFTVYVNFELNQSDVFCTFVEPEQQGAETFGRGWNRYLKFQLRVKLK
jgi:hypothetical protein